jgi:hypothetical protein
MKSTIRKTIVMTSLATAGMCTHAEGISFYALLDGGIAHTSIKGAGVTASETEFVTGGFAPNFVGLTSEKKLDAGYSVGFKMEQGFLLNQRTDGVSSRYFFGDDAVLNRQANVFIKGNLGKLTVGTQPNIAFNSVLMADPRSGSNFGSSLAAVVISGGLGTIDNGSLSVTAAPMSGLSISAQYVPQQSTPVGVQNGSRLAVVYTAGNFAATAAGYTNTSSTTTPDSSGTVLGSTYKFGNFTAKALHLSQKNASTESLKTNGLGGSYALTSETNLDFGTFKSTKTGYDMSTNAVGVYHKLMKDLTIYGQYASVKNKGTSDTPYNFAPPTNITGTITTGQKADTINIGLLFSYF